VLDYWFKNIPKNNFSGVQLNKIQLCCSRLTNETHDR
jgi:hypothetical protein